MNDSRDRAGSAPGGDLLGAALRAVRQMGEADPPDPVTDYRGVLDAMAKSRGRERAYGVDAQGASLAAAPGARVIDHAELANTLAEERADYRRMRMLLAEIRRADDVEAQLADAERDLRAISGPLEQGR